jgi:hypothetical protein
MASDLSISLTLPNGEERRLDTPDSALIGLWLKSQFDSYRIRQGGTRIPLQFTIRIY